MARQRTYGFKSTVMADNMSMEELTALSEEIRADPKNANPAHAAGRSIYLYTPAANKKLDAIAWAITYLLKRRRSETPA